MLPIIQMTPFATAELFDQARAEAPVSHESSVEAQNVRIRMDDFTNDFIVESPDLPLESRYSAVQEHWPVFQGGVLQ